MTACLRKGHLSEPGDHGGAKAESRGRLVEHMDLFWDLNITEVQNRDLWEEGSILLILETRGKPGIKDRFL